MHAWSTGRICGQMSGREALGHVVSRAEAGAWCRHQAPGQGCAEAETVLRVQPHSRHLTNNVSPVLTSSDEGEC